MNRKHLSTKDARRRPEPKYAREVFQRLRAALDVLLEEGGLIAWKDEYIAPNYDLRADGAWLLPNAQLDEFNWVPACDLEPWPGSPDPLTTPALPFPFTAKQLAAFMLHGWGWFLASRFEGEDEKLDEVALKALLGGVRDAKAREAIIGAFDALARARRCVGVPHGGLRSAVQAAEAALASATKEAMRLHDWRESGIAEQERSARVRKRKKLTAAAVGRLMAARAACEKQDETWRKSVVRWLLRPEGTKLSRDEWAALSNDAKVAAWFDGCAPDPTHEEELETSVGWYDETVRADYWVGLSSISPFEAAQLLSCENPHDANSGEWLSRTSQHMNPEAKRELLRGFLDLGGARPLTEWLQFAKSRGWRYDPWIDEYISARGTSLPHPAVGPPPGNSGVKRLTPTEERQARRYQACVDAGLRMPADDYTHLPRGIHEVAKALKISRQSLSADVKAHLARLSGRSRR